MRRVFVLGVGAATVGLSALAANAQTFAISIGIRETGTTAAIGQNGGTLNGIEFVNLDGQSLVLDGTWQTFTFNFQSDPLTPFAGTTANGMYDGTRGVLEHIRIRNSSGVTQPVQLFIDNILNTTSTGVHTVVDFEGHGNGVEVAFQEPGFSGSTSGNIAPAPAPNFALTSDAFAFAGTHSDEVQFQFIDGLDTRWIRLTTFGTAIQPNPTIEFAPGDTLTFQIRGVVVPEPASVALLGLGSVGLLLRRRRN